MLDAISERVSRVSEQKGGYGTALQQIQAAILEVQELADSYALRLPVKPEIGFKLIEFRAMFQKV